MTLALRQHWRVLDGVHDCHRRQQAGDDCQEDGPAHAKDGNQAQGEQRTGDRAEVVHRALEAVGAPVGCPRDDIGQQRVSGRYAQTPGEPGAGSQSTDLPRRAGQPDGRGEDRR